MTCRRQATAVAQVETHPAPQDLFQGAVAWPTALFVLVIAVLVMFTAALVLSFVLSRRAIQVRVEPAPKPPALEAASYV